MTYTNPELIRKYCGFKDEVTEKELEQFVPDGDREVFGDIAITKKNIKLSGVIDGGNKNYWVPYRPIADTNYDKKVSSLDIKVYKWGKAGSLDLREECTVVGVDPYEGRIKLATAPADTFEVISADYAYYSNTIDFDLVEKAASYYAGYLYAITEWALIPTRYARGAIRFSHAKPYETFLKLYESTIEKIIRKPFKKKKAAEITMKRKLISEL